MARSRRRRLWQSPFLFVALLVGGSSTALIERALAALGEAGRIRAGMEQMAALVAAENAASAFITSGGASKVRHLDAGGGIEVSTAIQPLAGTDLLELDARVGARRFAYLFRSLPGNTPPVFGRPLTVPSGIELPAAWPVAGVAGAADLPRLECARAVPAPSSLFAADAGIALLRLPAGTDRPDFVPVLDPSGEAIEAGGSRDVLAIDGNLWIDAAGAPLRIVLSRDLTIVVHGNLYVGRSLIVEGPGQLTLVTTTERGCAFADADGNGRWSAGEITASVEPFAGPMEGAGNVYLGLPRGNCGQLELDAGLVVGGYLNVAADRVTANGPLVLRCGGIALPGHGGALVATGRRLPPMHRAALPGFATVGGPQPGRLQPLIGDPLYPAAPAR